MRRSLVLALTILLLGTLPASGAPKKAKPSAGASFPDRKSVV